MDVIRKSFFGKAVSVSALAMLVITMNSSMLYAASAIKVKHEPPAYFVPEKRISFEIRIMAGTSDIRLIRCYFRSAEQADYVFVAMNPTHKGRYLHKGLYSGILPAPGKDTQTVQYLFLIVDQNNQPIKTQVFTMNKQDGKDAPEWQQVSSDGDIQVSTELADAPKSVPGFSDSIAMDVIESSARFGVAAGGIYEINGATAAGAAGSASGTAGTAAGGATASTAAGTGAAATEVGTTVAAGTAAGTGTTAAVTAGTVTATTVATGTAATVAVTAVGLSTATMVGIGVGAAALVGGGAAIAAGGSSNDENTPTPDTVSTWEFHSKCANFSAEAPVLFNIQLNETKGNSFDGSGSGQRKDYGDGIPVTMSMTGNYDAKTRALSGVITTNTSKLAFSCVRHDNFSFAIPSGSNDTGYQNVFEQGSTGCGTESGCVMQIRFIRK